MRSPSEKDLYRLVKEGIFMNFVLSDHYRSRDKEFEQCLY
jgi:hypothetical protein